MGEVFRTGALVSDVPVEPIFKTNIVNFDIEL
jgi:hypothetical protein